MTITLITQAEYDVHLLERKLKAMTFIAKCRVVSEDRDYSSAVFVIRVPGWWTNGYEVRLIARFEQAPLLQIINLEERKREIEVELPHYGEDAREILVENYQDIFGEIENFVVSRGLE